MPITYRKQNAKKFNVELAKLIEAYNKGLDILNAESLMVSDSGGNSVAFSIKELRKHKKLYFEDHQYHFFTLIEQAKKLDSDWFLARKSELKSHLIQLKETAEKFNVVPDQNVCSLETDLMSPIEFVEHQFSELVTGVTRSVAGSITSLVHAALHPQQTARGLMHVATHPKEVFDLVAAEANNRPAHTAGRVLGSLGTSVAIGAATGFLAGHEQLVALPVTTGATIPNPDTLGLMSLNGHLVPATAVTTNTINGPVLAATSGVTLASQVSGAGVDDEKSEELKLSDKCVTLFGKKPAQSDAHTVPHATLTC